MRGRFTNLLWYRNIYTDGGARSEANLDLLFTSDCSGGIGIA